MQLTAPFFQLPWRFDAARLADEIAQFTAAEWRPHPQGHPGNSALPFIARHGNPLDDGLVGPMRPTPHLARCPYVMQVMAALDVPLGRSRLMRLDAGAEATPHVDLGYYWQHRVRVHVSPSREYYLTINENVQNLDWNHAISIRSTMSFICTGNGLGVQVMGGDPPIPYQVINIERAPRDNAVEGS